MQKTVFFRNCLGVFQGGGCRAAAFAGAYEEAVRRGVSFSEVAGASAGSVVAALIGAGASPTFISGRLSALKFTELLTPPERNALRGIFSKVGFAKQALDIYFDHGLYSTKALKIWVDQLLSALLPAVHGPVTFNSLPLPTFIVSTDLAAMSAKVWSQQTTPNEQVSEAVVASCSIPIFFQPTNGRYVDGGLLSNLPSYVFASGVERRPLASKILAFSLQSETVNTEISGIWDYTSRLLSTLIDGGKRLQLELQSNVHVIDIPTGSVRATDFAKMTPEVTKTLIEGGAKATAEFLERERINIHSITSRPNICFDQDVTHCRITEFASQRLYRVIISESNSDWVYRLFPTILSLREQGAIVDVILPEFGDNEKHGPYRRRLLSALGARVTVLKGQTTVPLAAIVMLPPDICSARALIRVEKEPKLEAHSVLYEGHLDAAIVRLTVEKLESQLAPDTCGEDAACPTLVRVMDEEILSPLRKVRQYAGSNVLMSIEEVEVSNLVATSRLTREFKYNQIRYLIDIYRKRGLKLFEPCAVMLANGMKSIVTPPVVEEAAGQYILIEGSTRATFCRDEGIPLFSCVVVRGVSDPIPSRLFDFNKVRLTGRELPTSERYEGFTYEQFRPIESVVHPLDSLK